MEKAQPSAQNTDIVQQMLPTTSVSTHFKFDQISESMGISVNTTAYITCDYTWELTYI